MTSVGVTLPALTAHAESGFTVGQLRAFVLTRLPDAALQTLLADAVRAIEDEIGPPGRVREFLLARGDLLLLSRRASAIDSVTEWWTPWMQVALDPTDYQLRESGQQLQRLRNGTHPSTWMGGYGWGWGWRGRIEVLYTPVDDTASRIRAAVELVKLEIAYAPGLQAQSIGTWSETYQRNDPYDRQRAAILASLSGDAGGGAV